jgi:hypothetical protein
MPVNPFLALDAEVSPREAIYGFVAKFWGKRLRPVHVVGGLEFRLDSESEQCGDEKRLAGRICFGQPSHSTFPDHVHSLDALQRPSCTLKRAVG